jgi:hypothetical protein
VTGSITSTLIPPRCARAEGVEVDVVALALDAVAVDDGAAGVDRLGELLRGGAAVADALYLMPKSPSGPPGLWLADRISPPNAPRRRITVLTAGVDSSPPRPTSTRAKPLAAAMRRMVRTAARLWKRPSPPSTRVWPAWPGRVSNTACTKFSR